VGNNPRQRVFEYRGWGGARVGAGRPKVTEETVPHSTRPVHAARNPVHVTLRLRKGLPRLRRAGAYQVIRGAFVAARGRFGLRLNHYAVLGNHLHLIVEAPDRRAVTRGMQGMAIRLAKRSNRWWDRRGSVFAERYHEHALRTPREVRNALAYVLLNARKHGLAVSASRPDSYSSGAWFDGWNDGPRFDADRGRPRPVLRARTWLQSFGWRRHGLVRLAVTPGRR
jgi:REP element-mobilizing transposase RayT